MVQFLVPALIGVGVFVLGWFQYRKVRASRAWPAVTGRVVSARVDSEVNSGDDESADSTSYFPSIVYEYQAGSATLRGSQIAFTRRTYPSAKQADKALAAFPLGTVVQVYYDPATPSEAVLQRTASAGVVLMAVGALIAVLAVAALVVS